MNEHIQGLCRALGDMSNPPSPELTEVGRRWESERWLMRNDPLRAALYRIEAIADQRVSGNQCAASSLAEIRDLVVRVIAQHDGKPYRNPLFP